MNAFGALYVLGVLALALLSGLGVASVPGVVLVILAAPIALGVLILLSAWFLLILAASDVAKRYAGRR